jgi:hypothetical protein
LSRSQAMVMLQPVSGLYIVEEFVKSVGIEDGYDKFDKAVHERTGFHLSEQSPLKHVKAVTVPTLVAQVHDDTMTRPQDVQEIYDAIPVAEKSLYWTEGTDRRFDGYNFFGAHPELPIEWFDTSTDVRLNANGKHPNSARLSSVSREVPTASYILSANPYDFGVIIRKPVFELVVKPDLGLFPPPKWSPT